MCLKKMFGNRNLCRHRVVFIKIIITVTVTNRKINKKKRLRFYRPLKSICVSY